MQLKYQLYRLGTEQMGLKECEVTRTREIQALALRDVKTDPSIAWGM